MSSESIPPGVVFLDHTADVGLDVTAATLAELFTRAAVGMACLISGADRAGDARDAAAVADRAPDAGDASLPRSFTEHVAQRRVSLSAEDAAALLRAWLRELLRWHEAEGLALRDARFDVLTDTRLDASVRLAPETFQPVREIKGVTLHGLLAERCGGGWTGRVIFDV
jgi:SHS2 domain-containing protein